MFDPTWEPYIRLAGAIVTLVGASIGLLTVILNLIKTNRNSK